MIDFSQLQDIIGYLGGIKYGGLGGLQTGKYEGELSLLQPQLRETGRQFDVSSGLQREEMDRRYGFSDRELAERRRQFDVLNALMPQLQQEQINRARIENQELPWRFAQETLSEMRRSPRWLARSGGRLRDQPDTPVWENVGGRLLRREY